jgi:hypothetical protein
MRHIPPYVPHQEINADPNNTCEAVIVRSGQEPVVVNLELQTQIQPALGAEVCPFTLIGEDLPLLLKLAGHCPPGEPRRLSLREHQDRQHGRC